jgi:SnoaL-like protein
MHLILSIAVMMAAPPLLGVNVPVRSAISGGDAMTSPDSVAVGAAVTRFLTAFENLDWETFRACFDDSATVFYPTPEPPPPFHRLEPEHLAIDCVGSTIAVVTFQLRNSERLARRTLVFQKTEPGGWRIVHLHASNVGLR